jgi:hypothetical protein
VPFLYPLPSYPPAIPPGEREEEGVKMERMGRKREEEERRAFMYRHI